MRDNTNKNDKRCQAITKAGKPCRAAATAGGLCFFHANPNKASELGQIGGRRGHGVKTENPEPLPEVNSINALRNALPRFISDAYTGKLHPRVLSGLVGVLNLQLHVLQQDALEELEQVKSRVALLEEHLERQGQ